MFERILEKYGTSISRMLTVQYRMHQKIMTFSSLNLYENRLVADDSVNNHRLVDLIECKPEPLEVATLPLIFVDTDGYDMIESTTLDPKDKFSRLLDESKFNCGEATIAHKHCKLLIESGIKEDEIGIISPYNAQVSHIVNLVRQKYPKIEIHSVDGFQGREKEAIIVSLVRSNDKGEVGFLKDYRRLNVAITRPRRHLCVIADSKTVFKNLLKKKDKNSNQNLESQNQFLYKLGLYLQEHAEIWYPDMYD